MSQRKFLSVAPVFRQEIAQSKEAAELGWSPELTTELGRTPRDMNFFLNLLTIGYRHRHFNDFRSDIVKCSKCSERVSVSSKQQPNIH